MSAAPVEITECFQTVVSDAMLLHDLVCDTGGSEWPAVSIRASDITVDLGGHVIFGYFKPAGIGVKAEGVEGVTVRNGIIDGFLSGVDIVDSRDVTVEGVTIRNTESESADDFILGMRIFESHEVLIRSCSFEFLPNFHKEAVILSNGEAVLDAIQLSAGSVAVNFGGLCKVASARSRGMVINSRFVGVMLSGILVQCTTSARIANNEFAFNGDGITADPAGSDYVTGLTVEGNYIYGGRPDGIHLLGNAGSRIVNNVVRDKLHGIALEGNKGCWSDDPGAVCFYATGNELVGNRVLGNVIDLIHHENAVGNTWQDNTCQTREGVEIPECTGPPRRNIRRRLD